MDAALESLRVKVEQAMELLAKGSVSLKDFKSEMAAVGIKARGADGWVLPVAVRGSLMPVSPLTQVEMSEGDLRRLLDGEAGTSRPAASTPERLGAVMRGSFMERLNMSIEDPEKLVKLLSRPSVLRIAQAKDREDEEEEAAMRRQQQLARGAPLNRLASESPGRWRRLLSGRLRGGNKPPGAERGRAGAVTDGKAPAAAATPPLKRVPLADVKNQASSPQIPSPVVTYGNNGERVGPLCLAPGGEAERFQSPSPPLPQPCRLGSRRPRQGRRPSRPPPRAR